MTMKYILNSEVYKELQLIFNQLLIFKILYTTPEQQS